MEIFRAEGWGWPEYLIDLLVQLAFLAGLVALTMRVWPTGIAEASFSSISMQDWVLAAAAIFAAVATAAVFYFIVLEFALVLAKGTPRAVVDAADAVTLDAESES